MKQAFFHEQLRSERSGRLAAACCISEYTINIVFYDLVMKRRYARTVSYGTEMTASAVLEEFTSLFASAVVEFGFGGDIEKVGIAARFNVESALDGNIDRAEIGIPESAEMYFVPFISALIGGDFTASLLTISGGDHIAAQFGKTLYCAKRTGSELICASFPMAGAFCGSGLESGMPAEKGAIDAVRRDRDGTVSYEVVGDAESAGISPCAAAMAAVIMKRLGVLDGDGIITDRDMFYVGEDYFVSQGDVRAIQADKAAAAAAFEVFFGKKGDTGAFFSGEVFSDARGLRSLLELGAIPNEYSGAAFCRNSAEQGTIMFLEDEKAREAAYKLAESAEDVTEQLNDLFIRSYYEHLGF